MNTKILLNTRNPAIYIISHDLIATLDIIFALYTSIRSPIHHVYRCPINNDIACAINYYVCKYCMQ